MPRPLRIQYEGACYHVVSRGDRREDIFVNDNDRNEFLRTLGAACLKTGWQVHAYCLMDNHFHLVVETPKPNLVVGMKWLLGTYTQRFNRRHHHWGHLFGGRYKAQLIDSRSRGYLRSACDYTHLNPVRARMVAQPELNSFKWSSYPAYLRPKLRAPWLRTDRLLGEHGLEKDIASTRRAFERGMRQLGIGNDVIRLLRRGWKIGGEDFRDRLAEKLSRYGRKGEKGRERAETDAALAERLALKTMAQFRWKEKDLAATPKSHVTKVKIARILRTQTPMSRQWIADRLSMGSASYVSTLLTIVDK
jgi:REP element-mobilizing transposase RayT